MTPMQKKPVEHPIHPAFFIYFMIGAYRSEYSGSVSIFLIVFPQ